MLFMQEGRRNKADNVVNFSKWYDNDSKKFVSFYDGHLKWEKTIKHSTMHVHSSYDRFNGLQWLVADDNSEWNLKNVFYIVFIDSLIA